MTKAFVASIALTSLLALAACGTSKTDRALSGGAQMYAYDVNGDGLNDVITSFAAHGYGLVWYEQFRTNGEISFKQS